MLHCTSMPVVPPHRPNTTHPPAGFFSISRLLAFLSRRVFVKVWHVDCFSQLMCLFKGIPLDTSVLSCFLKSASGEKEAAWAAWFVIIRSEPDGAAVETSQLIHGQLCGRSFDSIKASWAHFLWASSAATWTFLQRRKPHNLIVFDRLGGIRVIKRKAFKKREKKTSP